jgi:hypothetical protein
MYTWDSQLLSSENDRTGTFWKGATPKPLKEISPSPLKGTKWSVPIASH